MKTAAIFVLMACSLSVGCAGKQAGDANSASPAAVAMLASWMSVEASAKTVTFDITMGVPGPNRFNFNGYTNGGLTITVPRGWKVRMNVVNQSSGAPHSLEVASVTGAEPMTGVRPAFAGAATKDLIGGFAAGASDEISFVADRSGNYQILCGVDGHAAAGMWGSFVVSSAVKLPGATVR